MRVWTQAGRDRQVELVRGLKQKLQDCVSGMQDLRCGNNGGNGNDRVDLVAYGDTKAMIENRLCIEETLLADIRVEVPRQTKRGQVGLEVRIRYNDDFSRWKRGEEESFIIGGPGELDDDEVLRTYSCDSPLGKAVVRAEVGDDRTVVTPSGDTYDIEILGFSIPQRKALAKTAA